MTSHREPGDPINLSSDPEPPPKDKNSPPEWFIILCVSFVAIPILAFSIRIGLWILGVHL